MLCANDPLSAKVLILWLTYIIICTIHLNQKSSKEATTHKIIQGLSPKYARIIEKSLAVETFQRQTCWNDVLLTALSGSSVASSPPSLLFLPSCQTRPCLKFLSPPHLCCLHIYTPLSWGKISTSWQNWRKHVRVLSERETSFLQLFLDASQNFPFWLLLLTPSPHGGEGIF